MTDSVNSTSSIQGRIVGNKPNASDAATGIPATGWQTTGSAVRGQSHIADGKPCQDAWDVATNGEWLFAAVADGAGSAEHAEIGAEHLVKSVVDSLAGLQAEFTHSNEAFSSFWAAAVNRAVEQARDRLAAGILHPSQISHVLSGDPHLADYHATLVGAVSNGEHCLLFHLGDGFAAAVTQEEWEVAEVSKPENGRYANETFFFTQPQWQEHLRCKTIAAPESLWLMSDGCAAFAANRSNTGLDSRFAAPVHRFLMSTSDAALRAKALAQTLDSAATHRITGDDKTLLWAGRDAGATSLQLATVSEAP